MKIIGTAGAWDVIVSMSITELGRLSGQSVSTKELIVGGVIDLSDIYDTVQGVRKAPADLQAAKDTLQRAIDNINKAMARSNKALVSNPAVKG